MRVLGKDVMSWARIHSWRNGMAKLPKGCPVRGPPVVGANCMYVKTKYMCVFSQHCSWALQVSSLPNVSRRLPTFRFLFSCFLLASWGEWTLNVRHFHLIDSNRRLADLGRRLHCCHWRPLNDFCSAKSEVVQFPFLRKNIHCIFSTGK